MNQIYHSVAVRLCSAFVALTGVVVLVYHFVFIDSDGAVGLDDIVLGALGLTLILVGGVLIVKNIAKGKLLLWMMFLLSLLSAALIVLYGYVLRMGSGDGASVVDWWPMLWPLICLGLFVWLMVTRDRQNGRPTPRLNPVLGVVALVAVSLLLVFMMGLFP